MKENACGVSHGVDLLRRQAAGADECLAVIDGRAETHSAQDTDLEASTKGHAKSCIRIRAREGENGAGGLEGGGGVGDAEESVHKGSQAGSIAPLELWPGEEVKQPGVERHVLCNGSARRLGTGRCERDSALVKTKMGGEIALDSEVSVQIPGDGGFKALAAFVEVSVGDIEARTEAERVIVGFDGGISAENLNFRELGVPCLLRLRQRSTEKHQ